MAFTPSRLHALQAALLLPPERLGEVRRRTISRTPISVLIGGLLSENEAGQLALRPRPLLKEWERCLRLSKNSGRHRFGRLTRPESLLLHHQGKPFFHPPGWLLWELRRSHERGVNHSGRHVMGLREFCDILSPVILKFGGHIGDGSLCVEISLISRRRRRFFYFAFYKRLLTSFSSRPGHGRDLYNFLNPLKLFLALEIDFTKSL
jgi:hypothetical protein